MSDPEADPESIATAISRFPAIAVRLVALANSAWTSPVAPIKSIEQTCTHLGLNLVRSLSLSIAVAAPFSPARCLRFDSELFWCNTLLLADCAANLSDYSAISGADDRETARAAALFSNLSLLWMADALPAETALALDENADTEVFPDQPLRRACGMDTGYVGGLLGRAWGLPDDLVAGMEHHGKPHYAGSGWAFAALVRVAADIVRSVNDDEFRADCVDDLERLRIEPLKRDKLIEKMSIKLDDTIQLTRSLRL
jgi:HD-like signal output (HDOD) protein